MLLCVVTGPRSSAKPSRLLGYVMCEQYKIHRRSPISLSFLVKTRISFRKKKVDTCMKAVKRTTRDLVKLFHTSDHEKHMLQDFGLARNIWSDLIGLTVVHKEESGSVKGHGTLWLVLDLYLDLLLLDWRLFFFYVMANPRVIFISWNQQVDSIRSRQINNALLLPQILAIKIWGPKGTV